MNTALALAWAAAAPEFLGLWWTVWVMPAPRESQRAHGAGFRVEQADRRRRGLRDSIRVWKTRAG
ncbi:hypothetical protein ACFY04_42920 [Streptomyces sp. NPDC001549]|uniref:hypothetical protein n=1 Tax=Streptomyces sp. NPDC001549 TaxID=3364586 RepID=UPI0036B786B5